MSDIRTGRSVFDPYYSRIQELLFPRATSQAGMLACTFDAPLLAAESLTLGYVYKSNV